MITTFEDNGWDNLFKALDSLVVLGIDENGDYVVKGITEFKKLASTLYEVKPR